MKHLLLGSLFLFSTVAFSQDTAEMAGWMKSISATNGSLRKDIEAKNGDDAAKDAEKLADVYVQVGAFFAKTSTDDAVKVAKNGEVAAKAVATAARSGNFDEAASAAKGIGGTCGPCHTAHREKLEGGGYKIK
jgi:hypothetical protein